MPRLTYHSGLALLLVAGAFLLADRLLAPPPGVTEANVERVRAGMSVGRVEAIFGRAADVARDPPEREQTRHWLSEAGVASVAFSPGGRAVRARFHPNGSFEAQV